jgi:hypothetical protein
LEGHSSVAEHKSFRQPRLTGVYAVGRNPKTYVEEPALRRRTEDPDEPIPHTYDAMTPGSEPLHVRERVRDIKFEVEECTRESVLSFTRTNEGKRATAFLAMTKRDAAPTGMPSSRDRESELARSIIVRAWMLRQDCLTAPLKPK